TAPRRWTRLSPIILLSLPCRRGRIEAKLPALALDGSHPSVEEYAVRHLVLAIAIATVGAPLANAADTPSAANTRNKKLQTKISVEFNETRLSEALKEIAKLLEDADAGMISFERALGVSQNLQITCMAKDKTVAEILDIMFKKNGLGYIVVS